MSEIDGITSAIVDLFGRNRTREAAREAAYAAVHFGADHDVNYLLLRAYVTKAARLFAEGRERAARRFYDGAFRFTKEASTVRAEFVEACARVAKELLEDWQCDQMWLLYDAATRFAPDGMSCAELRSLFARHNVYGERVMRRNFASALA